MYFIPRNNALYSYVAHTNQKKRYLFTVVFFTLFIIGISYGIIPFLEYYTMMYEQEIKVLEHHYHYARTISKKNHDLKQNIVRIQQELDTHKANDICLKNKLLFILDTLQQSGLKINSYGIQKEKNGQWYIAEKAHFDSTGSLHNILSFLDTIKASNRMISVSQWSLALVEKDIFTLHCDITILCLV
jgi:Tfp pilus assembly protein PilO